MPLFSGKTNWLLPNPGEDIIIDIDWVRDNIRDLRATAITKNISIRELKDIGMRAIPDFSVVKSVNTNFSIKGQDIIWEIKFSTDKEVKIRAVLYWKPIAVPGLEHLGPSRQTSIPIAIVVYNHPIYVEKNGSVKLSFKATA